MHQYMDDRTRVLIGLMVANAGFFTLFFYRPKDVLPNSYDLLKWIAALHFIAGVLILASLAAPLFFFLLCITYLIAYKHCFKDIPVSIPKKTHQKLARKHPLFRHCSLSSG